MARFARTTTSSRPGTIRSPGLLRLIHPRGVRLSEPESDHVRARHLRNRHLPHLRKSVTLQGPLPEPGMRGEGCSCFPTVRRDTCGGGSWVTAWFLDARHSHTVRKWL